MTLAWVSLAALGAAIVAGMVWRVNVGLLALTFALLVGVGLGGMNVASVASGFPTQLFLVLLGMTLFFAQAQVNGTLDKLAHQTIRLARGNRGLVPIVFFGLAAATATLGAGNIGAVALLAPVALAAAARLGISSFLMIIMLANGANAGAFSPVAPTGIVAAELMNGIGLGGLEWRTYWNVFAANGFVAFAGYFTLGGLALIVRGRAAGAAEPVHDVPAPFAPRQWLTLGVLAALLVAVIGFHVDIALGAFAAASIVTLARAADEDAAVRAMPWSMIVMVCGVTTLVALLERTGALDRVVDMLVNVSTATSVTGVIAFVTGVVSAYSSSVGVVLPTFLPMTAGLAERLGADPLAIASSINVGAHLVDVSPLSTLGALCLAAAPVAENRQALFNKVLAWGLSMAAVGAVVCFVFFGVL